MTNQEERQKMAWQLVLSVVSDPDSDPEVVVKNAWKWVDSFLENEGGGEPPDQDAMRLNAVSRMNSLLHNEVEQLTNKRDKAHNERDEALVKVEVWRNNYELVAGKRDALKAENEKLTKELDFLTGERNKLRDERDNIRAQFKQKTELSNQEYERLLKAADYWKNNHDELADKFKQVTKELDKLKAEVKKLKVENERITKERDGFYKRAYERGGKIDNLAGENGHLAVGIDKLESEVRKLKSKNERLHEELSHASIMEQQEKK